MKMVNAMNHMIESHDFDELQGFVMTISYVDLQHQKFQKTLLRIYDLIEAIKFFYTYDVLNDNQAYNLMSVHIELEEEIDSLNILFAEVLL